MICFLLVYEVYSRGMETKGYFRQDLFALHLSKLVEDSKGVEAAFLVNAEGFAMASAGKAFSVNEIAALSTLAGNALKRARSHSGLNDADEVIIINPERRYIVCKEFEHKGETTGSYLLVIVCSETSYDAAALNSTVVKINDALGDFY
jgi:predicted regulator of Ras-like GTPase activity (Roadblock/LC7/MglB family)